MRLGVEELAVWSGEVHGLTAPVVQTSHQALHAVTLLLRAEGGQGTPGRGASP